MKKKPTKKVSVGRILQISNDISEDMCSASNEEPIAVVKYWRDRYEKWNALYQKRMFEASAHLKAFITEPYPGE